MSEEELHLEVHYYISVYIYIYTHTQIHTHTHFDEINTWQKVVISLDTFQSLVIKLMEVYWEKPDVSCYIKRCKLNSTNKF